MEHGMPILKSKPITLMYDIPIGRTIKFWEGLKDGKIQATQCQKCGKTVFPPTADCPSCLSSEMTWLPLSEEAKVEAFTHIVVRPKSFQQERPYTVVIGTTKEEVRVLAWLINAKISEVRVGMKVKLVVTLNSTGDPVYQFEPMT